MFAVLTLSFFFEMGKKKQSFLGFTGKRAILHWATKIVVVHACISEIDSRAAFQLLHAQSMLMPCVSGAYPAMLWTYVSYKYTTYFLVLLG